MRIKLIKQIDKPDITYNLHIKDNHNYIVNGCVVANCHGAKATEMQKILKKLISTEYRIGCTGTVPKDDADRYTIIGMLGPVVPIIKAHELIEQDKATPVEIICCNLKYPEWVCDKYNSSSKKVSGEKKYRAEKTFLLNECTQRTEFIVNLCNHLEGNTLILVETLDGVDNIKTLLESKTNKKVNVVTGSVDKDERELIRIQVNKEKTNNIIVATIKTFSTGLNVPYLHNLILASPTKAYGSLIQSIGRVLRLADSKDVARVYDIIDNLCVTSKGGNVRKNYSYNHFLERLSIYTHEQYPYKISTIPLSIPQDIHNMD